MALEELQNGRYRYSRLLGGGGMGEVYLMQDTRVNRPVAIKVLRAESALYADDERAASSARLFEREARAIAALDHPNILPLYDFGEEVRDGQAITYMVMPYCSDGSLETWLRQHGGALLTPSQVAALIEQAAEGLQYAHEHKVIHLDVKPPNFLIRGNRKDPLRPTLLLADFGIARNFTTVASSSRTIRGTPAAMAPEQWSGEPVFASDQYALAIMAYEMLVGRPPFTGSMEQLMYRHFSVQPPPPSNFNARLPVALDAVLLRALSKKPEERFPSIGDFASALVEAAQQPAVDSDAAGSERARYATLEISQSEAEAGISRLLTLTGGEELTVSVPAGARHGQVLRLPGPASGSEQAEVVLVNIEIQQPRQARQVESASSEQLLDTPAPVGAEQAGRAVQAPETPLPQLHPQPEAALALGDEHDLPTMISQKSLESRADQPAADEHDLPTYISQGSLKELTGIPRPVTAPRSSRRRLSLLALISFVVVLLLIGGSIYVFANRQASNNSGQGTHAAGAQQAHTPTAGVTPTPSPTPAPGLNIAGKYNGSMSASDGSNYTPLSIALIQRNGSGALTGSATLNSSAQQKYQLQGTDDLQGKFTLIIQQPAGQSPLIFYGALQPGNYLHGNYCHAAAPPCHSAEGYFNVGPRY